MKLDWTKVRFTARLTLGSGRPTLSPDVKVWDVTVEIRGLDVYGDADRTTLEWWLDETFPGHTEPEWEPGEWHDCPSCTCEDDSALTFKTSLPGRSPRRVEDAVAALRVPSRPAVAA